MKAEQFTWTAEAESETDTCRVCEVDLKYQSHSLDPVQKL